MVDYGLLYDKAADIFDFKQKHFMIIDYLCDGSDSIWNLAIQIAFDKNQVTRTLKEIVEEPNILGKNFDRFYNKEINNYYKLLKFMDENE